MAGRFRQAQRPVASFWRRVASEDLVRLFDLLPDMSFFAKDQRGRFVALNRLACDFCGVADAAAALGKCDRDFFDDRRSGDYAHDDGTIFRTGRAVVGRIESAPERRGSPRLVVTTKVPLRDRSGRVVGVAGVSRRIERVRERPSEFAPLAGVIERMHEAYGGQPSSREWAALAGMSVSHFDRTFRRTFGTSPRQYFLKVRVDAACRRLAETRASVAAVALACGFYDHAHFTRSFRRIMGMTPTAYRTARQSPARSLHRRAPR
jgi:AraC-like DNA-binding protein